ncbi:MAG TPA: MBL fold metallo-hydrolase [Planctomycetes bacterium]|nr:MBL fold metallo-hydrolase [Planctomycetota bacterium]
MQCRLIPVLGNSQRLDGGAMFGNAPRVLWSRWCPPDDSNRIALATRALLVREERGRNVLLETGIGAFFPPDLRKRFGVEESGHVLLDNLQALGLSDEDIDVVVLSHLHFDHAGGLLAPYEEGATPRLLFPRARFVVGRRAFDRARHPHVRDRASFIPELPGLLEESGRLELVDGERSAILGEDYRLHFSDGHTPGLMLAELDDGEGPIVFAGDLIPGSPWMHLPITMGYDRYPELLIDEKRALLEDLIQRDGRVFFTHDVDVALARVVQDEKGRFRAEPLPL